MNGKWRTTEDKIRLLREADRDEKSVADICREVNISEVTFPGGSGSNGGVRTAQARPWWCGPPACAFCHRPFQAGMRSGNRPSMGTADGSAAARTAAWLFRGRLSCLRWSLPVFEGAHDPREFLLTPIARQTHRA